MNNVIDLKPKVAPEIAAEAARILDFGTSVFHPDGHVDRIHDAAALNVLRRCVESSLACLQELADHDGIMICDGWVLQELTEREALAFSGKVDDGSSGWLGVGFRGDGSCVFTTNFYSPYMTKAEVLRDMFLRLRAQVENEKLSLVG